MTTYLDLLANLGLPSAFVAMVVIALIFRKTHAKVSVAAAVMAVGLVGVFGVTQLVESASGKDIQIHVSADDVYALAAGGPTDLVITASRGNSAPVQLKLGKPSMERFNDRLKDLGWTLASDCAPQATGTPSSWSTNRVFAGQTQRLGLTKYGMLRIRAEHFLKTGEAVVTLILDGHESPIPNRLRIRNKGLGVQSFQEIPEFYVAVREADFKTTPQWAAFNVFGRQ